MLLTMRADTLASIVPPAGSASMTGTTPATSPELELLQRYQGGDRTAFDELVLMYQEPGFWIARQLLFDDELARDVVQDAFIRVIRRHQTFDPNRASFKAWFYQIIRNLAIDELRRKKVRPQEELQPEHHGDVDGQHSAGMEQAELGQRIRHIIGLLEQPYREVLQLRDVEGISAQEVATITDSDYGTTRWRIHEARKRFKALWTKHFGGEVNNMNTPAQPEDMDKINELPEDSAEDQAFWAQMGPAMQQHGRDPAAKAPGPGFLEALHRRMEQEEQPEASISSQCQRLTAIAAKSSGNGVAVAAAAASFCLRFC